MKKKNLNQTEENTEHDGENEESMRTDPSRKTVKRNNNNGKRNYKKKTIQKISKFYRTKGKITYRKLTKSPSTHGKIYSLKKATSKRKIIRNKKKIND